MPWSSNHTFLATCTLDGEETGGGVQARPGRAPAVGLPRERLPARGGGLRAVVRARLGHRPRDGGARRRPPRSGVGATIRPGRLLRSTTSRWSRTSGTTTGCGPFAPSTWWPTTRTARAVTACWARTATVWAIDNGLCFHTEPKLRTVIWEFAGEPVPGQPPRATWPASPALRWRRCARCCRPARSTPCAGGPTARGGRPLPRPGPRRVPLPLAARLSERTGVRVGACAHGAACRPTSAVRGPQVEERPGAGSRPRPRHVRQPHHGQGAVGNPASSRCRPVVSPLVEQGERGRWSVGLWPTTITAASSSVSWRRRSRTSSASPRRGPAPP